MTIIIVGYVSALLAIVCGGILAALFMADLGRAFSRGGSTSPALTKTTGTILLTAVVIFIVVSLVCFFVGIAG